MPKQKVDREWSSIKIPKDLYDKLKADKERTGISISKLYEKLYDDQSVFQNRLARIEDFMRKIGHYDLVWKDAEGNPVRAVFKTVVDKILNEPKT